MRSVKVRISAECKEQCPEHSILSEVFRDCPREIIPSDVFLAEGSHKERVFKKGMSAQGKEVVQQMKGRL